MLNPAAHEALLVPNPKNVNSILGLVWMPRAANLVESWLKGISFPRIGPGPGNPHYTPVLPSTVFTQAPEGCSD